MMHGRKNIKIQSRSLVMSKRKHPVKFFCPSTTINPLIHTPSFRLSFSLHRIIFAGGYDSDNDEKEVQGDEEEGEHVAVTLTQEYP